MKQKQPTEMNTIRVALFPQRAEKVKFWVAQCLDIDLVAQGETVEAAQQSFRRVLQGHICLALHNHRSPFASGLAQPPRKVDATTKPCRSTGGFNDLRICYNKLESTKTVAAW